MNNNLTDEEIQALREEWQRQEIAADWRREVRRSRMEAAAVFLFIAVIGALIVHSI